jgi:transmembrane sensor
MGLGNKSFERMRHRETSGEIDDTAADWAALIDRGPLSREDQRRLDAWTAADPRRAGALARALAVLAHFDRSRALGPQATPIVRAKRDALPRRQFIMGGAVAAGLGAVGVLAPGWLAAGREFETALGEIRSVPLDDGSVVWLNTDSKIRVDYQSDRRGVTLLAGEASFEVAKDPARPFIVAAKALDVRAIGTSFSVSRLDGRPVEVMVREGVVDVARPRGAPTQAVRLLAGARARASAEGQIATTEPGVSAVSRTLSWRQGLLDFEGVTLEEAARTFARYSEQQIIIEDPQVARRSVTGLFSSTDPAGFARAVALSLNLRARTTADGIVLSL